MKPHIRKLESGSWGVFVSRSNPFAIYVGISLYSVLVHLRMRHFMEVQEKQLAAEAVKPLVKVKHYVFGSYSGYVGREKSAVFNNPVSARHWLHARLKEGYPLSSDSYFQQSDLLDIG